MNEVSQDNIGRPSIVRFETQAGVILHITPLNLATLRAINLKADELLPYPDKKQYEKPLENAFVEGMVDSAENNPEYLKACEPVDQQRKEWTDKAVFHYAVRFQDYPTRESLISAFAPRLLELRKIALVQDDDYEAILHHIILTGQRITKIDASGNILERVPEYIDIIRIAIQTVALTPEEVTTGVRFFRANLRQDTPRKMVG